MGQFSNCSLEERMLAQDKIHLTNSAINEPNVHLSDDQLPERWILTYYLWNFVHFQYKFRNLLLGS